PGRQMLGIGVYRITEQEQLHHRQRDDQTQSHRIATHLDPFLAQHGQKASPGKCVHDAVFVWLSRWMNTSSSRGSTSRQVTPAPVSRMARSSAARLAPAIYTARPNTVAASTPGSLRRRRAASSTAAPVASKVVKPARWATSLGAPCTTIRPFDR